MGKKHKEKRNLYEIKRFFVDRGVENVISMLREMAENEKDDSNDPDRKVGTLTGKDWRGGEGGGLETNVLSGPKRLKSQEDNKGKAGGSEGEVTSVYEKDNVEPTVAKNNVMKNNAAFPKDMYLLSKDGSFLIKTIRNAYTKNGFNPNVKTVLVNWLDRKKKMEIERGKKIRALAEEDMEKMWFFFKDKIENLIKKVDSATQSNTLLRKKAIQMMQEYNFDKSDIHLGAYVRHEGSFIFIPYDKNTIYKLENGDFLPKGEQKDNSLKESAIPGMTNLVFFDFYRDYYEGFDKLVSGIYNIFEKYGTPTNNTVSKLVVTLLFHYIRFMLPSVTDIKKFRSFLFSSVIDEYELIPRIRTKKKDLTGVENFIVNGDTLYFKIGKEVSFNQLKMKYSFLEEIKEHFFECYQEYYRNEIMLALRRIFFNIEVAKETEDMSKMRTIGKLNIMYILNERINSVLYSIGPCVYVGTETEGNIEVYASSLFEFVGGKDFFVKKDVSGWENKKFSLMKYGITGGLIVFEREALLSSGNRQEIKKKMSQDILKRINNYSKKNFEHFYGDFFMKRVESIIGNTISGYMVGDEQEINAKERYTLPKVGTPYSDIVKKDFDILLKELGQSKFSFLGRMHILFYLIFGNENAIFSSFDEATIESEKGKINNVTRKFSEKITDEKEKQEFVEAFDKAVDFSIKLMDKIKNSAYEWRKFAFRHLGGNNFTPQNVKVMVDFLDEYYLQVLSYYQGVNKLALADKMSSDTNYMHFMQSSLRKIAKAKKTLRDYVDGKSPSTNDIDEANDIILGSSSFLLLSFFAHKSNLITDKYDRFLVYLTEKVRIAYRIFFKYYSSQHKETGGTKLSSDVMKFGEVEEVFKMLDEGLFSSNVLGVSATI